MAVVGAFKNPSEPYNPFAELKCRLPLAWVCAEGRRDAVGGSAQKSQPGFFNKLSNFFSGLDIGRDAGYNEDDSGPSRAGASISDPRALLNPLTYRGYLYDPDVDMYYLQSRFYNPHSGRFLNADQVFDTGTGVLGTNMFAYCDNNPVNKVDKTGKWSYDVHLGVNGSTAQALVLQGPPSEHYGIKYGTKTWARDVGFENDLHIYEIMFGNWQVQDGLSRAGYLTIVLFKLTQSWHTNMNNYETLNMLLPDTRDLRSLEKLVNLEINLSYFKDAKTLYTNGQKAKAWLSLQAAMCQLGMAVHPAQDKDGHHDYWTPPTFTISGLIWAGKEYGTDGDGVGLTYPLNGVTYYHWDDLIRSRDATYNILGRFYKEYERVINMK